MNKIKASEFGELIGQSRQYINANCNRGKIIKDEKGLFDLDNPINKIWHDIKREEYIAKNSVKGAVKKDSKPKPLKNINIPSSKYTDKEEESKEDPEEEVETLVSFAQLKQQAELDFKMLSIQEKKIELEKKQGKLLNIDTANKITTAYMTMFKKSLQRDLETLIHKICDVYKVDLEEKAKYVNELMERLNIASDRTMEELTNSLQIEDKEL